MSKRDIQNYKLAELLEDIKKTYELTTTALAEKLGISSKTATSWLTKKTLPSNNNQLMIFKTFPEYDITDFLKTHYQKPENEDGIEYVYLANGVNDDIPQSYYSRLSATLFELAKDDRGLLSIVAIDKSKLKVYELLDHAELLDNYAVVADLIKDPVKTANYAKIISECDQIKTYYQDFLFSMYANKFFENEITLGCCIAILKDLNPGYEYVNLKDNVYIASTTYKSFDVTFIEKLYSFANSMQSINEVETCSKKYEEQYKDSPYFKDLYKGQF